MEASSPVGSRIRTKKSLNPVDSNQHPRNFFPSLRPMGFLYNTPRDLLLRRISWSLCFLSNGKDMLIPLIRVEFAEVYVCLVSCQRKVTGSLLVSTLLSTFQFDGLARRADSDWCWLMLFLWDNIVKFLKIIPWLAKEFIISCSIWFASEKYPTSIIIWFIYDMDSTCILNCVCSVDCSEAVYLFCPWDQLIISTWSLGFSLEPLFPCSLYHVIMLLLCFSILLQETIPVCRIIWLSLSFSYPSLL